MNFDGKKSTEGSAWEVASDPSASEKHWMAACTLLDGKQHPAVRSRRKLPSIVGLPWSMAVSGFAALGATLIFSFIEYSIGSVLPGSHVPVFDGAHSYALVGGLFVAFSSVFVYQKHIWGGGRLWWGPYFGLMGLLACLQWGFGGIPFLNQIVYGGLSLLTIKLTLNSIKALETIGAQNVLAHGRNILVGTGVMCVAMRVLTFPSNVATLVMLAWVPICLLGSGYAITMLNKTANPRSASTIALSAWAPLTLTNLFLFAVVVVSAAANLVTGTPQPGLESLINSILIAAGTLTCLTLGPVIGATTASRMVRRARELELHKTPAHILSELAPEGSNTDYLETSSSPSV